MMKEQKLGFGCMRLPVLDASDPTSFDYEKIEKLFDFVKHKNGGVKEAE